MRAIMEAEVASYLLFFHVKDKVAIGQKEAPDRIILPYFFVGPQNCLVILKVQHVD